MNKSFNYRAIWSKTISFLVTEASSNTDRLNTSTQIHLLWIKPLIQLPSRQIHSAIKSNWFKCCAVTGKTGDILVFLVNYIHQSPTVYLCLTAQQCPLILWQYLTDLQFSLWRARVSPPPAGFSRPVYTAAKENIWPENPRHNPAGIIKAALVSGICSWQASLLLFLMLRVSVWNHPLILKRTDASALAVLWMIPQIERCAVSFPSDETCHFGLADGKTSINTENNFWMRMIFYCLVLF